MKNEVSDKIGELHEMLTKILATQEKKEWSYILIKAFDDSLEKAQQENKGINYHMDIWFLRRNMISD